MATGELIEQVAENFEEAAAVTRRLNGRIISAGLIGVGIGAAIGFYFGYRWNREKIKAEIFKESEEEIEKIRELYQQKAAFMHPKPSVDEVIEERGYVKVQEEVRPLKPPVPGVVEPKPLPTKYFAGATNAQFSKRTEENEKSKNDGWSYPHELSTRSPDRPFIIHQDEFFGNESGYQQVTYSYYMGDDIFTDERDQILDNVDNLIGLDNLEHWGHGADDFNVLYIRNTKLELEFEVCRTPKSFESEVLGLDDHETDETD